MCTLKRMTNPLLTIARQLYEEQGLRLSVSEIAAQAGVSRAVVYQKLGRKAEILRMLAPDSEGDVPDIEARIMKAVLEAAVHSGVRAATVENIAQRAGVGEATIYRRFGGKDGLLRSFIASHAPSAGLNALDLGDGKTRDQLETLIRFLVTYMKDNRDIVRLVQSGSDEDRAYLRALRAADQSTSMKITSFFEAQQNAGTVRSDIPAAQLAANLAGMLYAHVIFVSTAQGLDADEITRAILHMFDSVLIEDTP